MIIITNIEFWMENENGGGGFNFPNLPKGEYGLIIYNTNGFHNQIKITKEEYERHQNRIEDFWKDFARKHPNATI